MLFWISLLLVSSLALLFVGQVAGNEYYLHWYQRSHRGGPVDDAQLPRTAVVLSLRGADESLSQCLDRLASLNFPDYEIHVVFDHETDPSRALVERWRERHPRAAIYVQVLSEISPSAYLKTSAIRQCLKSLPDTVGAAVMVDADTVVYADWLRDIVSPFMDPAVGLVTGNRWYDPTVASWGARIRFIYNAWSVPAMFFMRATWGGSLALRREVYQQDYFFDRMWDTSSEESAMQDAMRNVGLRLDVHPKIMMLQRDTINLTNCFRFIRRQLVWTRLYHPHWPLVFAGTVAVYLLAGTALLLGVYQAAHGAGGQAAALLGIVVTLILGNLGVLERMHRIIVQRIADVQQVDVPRLRWSDRWQLLAAIPITLILYTWALLAAAVARRVAWRGVTYRLKPPRQLELVEYRPYEG